MQFWVLEMLSVVLLLFLFCVLEILSSIHPVLPCQIVKHVTHQLGNSTPSVFQKRELSCVCITGCFSILVSLFIPFHTLEKYKLTFRIFTLGCAFSSLYKYYECKPFFPLLTPAVKTVQLCVVCVCVLENSLIKGPAYEIWW